MQLFKNLLANLLDDLLAALQFLTRIPVPARPYTPQNLSRATLFFPLVGALIGALAAAVFLTLDPHLPRLATATLTLAFTALLTGALHEDGLADTADGFGGGRTRDQVLLIFRDSRLGTYGVLTLVLSLLLRIALLAALPRPAILPTLITAHLLARWTTLPLSHFLPPARPPHDGQGARIAAQTTRPTLWLATAYTLALSLLLLHTTAIAPLLATLLLTLLTGLYYRHRLLGVTGDTFGATNQLTELLTYLCAIWT